MNRRATAISATRRRTFRRRMNSLATSRPLHLKRACSARLTGIARHKKRRKHRRRKALPCPRRLLQNPDRAFGSGASVPRLLFDTSLIVMLGGRLRRDVRDPRIIHLFIERRQVLVYEFLDLRGIIANQRTQFR